MGFGGSVHAMITSLKNNARPKRKPFSRLKNSRNYSKKEGLTFLEVSDKKLTSIKKNIKLDAQRSNRKELWVLAIFIFVFSTSFLVVLNTGIKNRLQESRLSPGKPEYVKKYENEIRENEGQYQKYINKGYRYIEEGNYESAKLILYYAYVMRPNEYIGVYLYAKVFVLDCINNRKNCKKAKQMLDYLEYSFPKKQETEYLTKLFNDEE